MFDSVSRTAASLFNVFHPKTFSLYLGGPGQVSDVLWQKFVFNHGHVTIYHRNYLLHSG